MNTYFHNSDVRSSDTCDSSFNKWDTGLPVRSPIHRIPLDLLLASTFRIPRPVTKLRIYEHRTVFSVCPRCNYSMEYKYQLYCGRCGQHLVWSKFDMAEEEFVRWDGIEVANNNGDGEA